MEQEENKHTTSSTGKVKYGRETKTIINWKIVKSIESDCSWSMECMDLHRGVEDFPKL